MRIHNVTFPVFITQTYIDQGNSGTAERPNNSSVELKNFTFANITGDINSDNPGDGSCRTNVSSTHRPTLPTRRGRTHLTILPKKQPCWYNQGLNPTQTESLILQCNTDTSCSGFETHNINVYPQKLEAPSVICFNIEADLNPNLGFDCANGTYVPT
jgi:hypothetical protein